MVFLAADTGLRRGELLALQWRDVDLVRGALVVRRSKSKRPREVPPTPRAREALEGVLGARKALPMAGEDPVFPELAALDPGYMGTYVSARFRKAAERAGFTGLRFHDLRHAFCSRLAQAGVAKQTAHDDESSWRFVLRHPDDAERLVHVAVLAFEVPPAP
jgi:integrase